MDKETRYLLTAIEKSGCVVVVRSYNNENNVNRKRLEYISENASDYGVNLNAIRQGYKLFEDYIYHEDREAFIDAVRISSEERKDFAYQIRIVGDDGVLRTVDVDVVYTDVTDSGYVIEFVAKPVLSQSTTEELENETLPQNILDEVRDDFHITKDFLKEHNVDTIIDAYAESLGLYSVVLDLNGKILVDPYGPSAFLGEFYEIVRNPKYISFYEEIRGCIRGDGQPVFSEIDDGNPDTRISAVPIYTNGRYVATWILYAHSKQQAQSLFKCSDGQAKIAKSLSYAITLLHNSAFKVKAMEQMNEALGFELRQKNALAEVLSDMYDSDENFTSELFRRVGELLDVDYVVYYKNSEESSETMDLIDYWSKMDKVENQEESFVWHHDHYDAEMREKIKTEGLVIDRNNMTNQMRVEVFRGNARAVIVQPIMVSGEYTGRLIIIENSKERVWTESEISFAKVVSMLISGIITMQNLRKQNENKVTSYLLDILKSMPVMAFIRNSNTGTVLFANDTINERLGMDFVGKDSFRVVPMLDNQYPVIDESESPDEGPVKFKRYINELGGVFDITETCIEWNDGSPASVLILRTAKD